jgi:hypothetical protein
MRWLRSAAAATGLAALLSAGCSDGPPYGEVRGEVTLDGQPVKQGVVRFIPLDGSTPTASALITDGRFSERVPVTSHRVEISAPRLPPGGPARRGTIDDNTPLEELIPERYNLRSELTADVKKGTQDIRYELTSKGR